MTGRDAPIPSVPPVRVIGGGLAGSEAAWQLARAGVSVWLYEMRPQRSTEAHQTAHLAELVCSNSLRSDDAERNAVGLLHEEMRRANSLILAMADAHKVPAGGALAVDREGFAKAVEKTLVEHPLITLKREEVSDLAPFSAASGGLTIVATGPLTAPSLATAIADLTRAAGGDGLAFFDAIAPIVYRDSVDLSVAWFQSRYDKGDPAGGGDYLNCPLDEGQYNAFIEALLTAEKSDFKEWETNTPYFEGCLPIEVMAARGRETLRFGPMKPVGLTNPHRAAAAKAHAVVQLRQDNALGTLYNLVGFQTKLKHGEQMRVFRMIPGLEMARFARLGGLHRNTFLNSPRLLEGDLRLKGRPDLRFAGQITGVEGYVESAAMGLLAGRFAAAESLGQSVAPPPPATALGALLTHITGGAREETFQPMNVNFGLFPPLPAGHKGKRGRKEAHVARARAALGDWLSGVKRRAG